MDVEHSKQRFTEFLLNDHSAQGKVQNGEVGVCHVGEKRKICVTMRSVFSSSSFCLTFSSFNKSTGEIGICCEEGNVGVVYNNNNGDIDQRSGIGAKVKVEERESANCICAND